MGQSTQTWISTKNNGWSNKNNKHCNLTLIKLALMNKIKWYMHVHMCANNHIL